MSVVISENFSPLALLARANSIMRNNEKNDVSLQMIFEARNKILGDLRSGQLMHKEVLIRDVVKSKFPPKLYSLVMTGSLDRGILEYEIWLELGWE